jgi:hydroxymethylglutaryl-CoA reductase
MQGVVGPISINSETYRVPMATTGMSAFIPTSVVFVSKPVRAGMPNTTELYRSILANATNPSFLDIQ